MLGGADNPNGELPSYITGANTEAFFYCTQHDILHRLFVIATGARCPVYDLSVAAVLREGYPQLFTVVTAELKAI